MLRIELPLRTHKGTRSNAKEALCSRNVREAREERKNGRRICCTRLRIIGCIILFSKGKSASYLRENHLSAVKGDLFCIDKAPARHGREHLSIVVDVPWKVNAARYHASRFNEPVSFLSYPLAQAHDPAHFLTNFRARLDKSAYIIQRWNGSRLDRRWEKTRVCFCKKI